MSRLKRQYGRKRFRDRRRASHSDEMSHLVREVLKSRKHDAERQQRRTHIGNCARTPACTHHGAFDAIFLKYPGTEEESVTALIEMLSLARQEAAESLEDAYAAEIIAQCIWKIMHRFGYLPSEDDWSRVPTVQ